MHPRGIIRITIGILIIVLLVAIILTVILSPYGVGPYPMMMGVTWAWIVPFLFFLLILMFLVRLIIWGPMGYRYGRRYGRWYGPGEEDAEEIIHKRYARGELTREQYNQMMDDLQKRRTQ